MVDYRHTWQIKRSSRILRLYCWAWEADTEHANICKLWWGYVFLPLGIFLTHILFPRLDRWDRRLEARAAQRRTAPPTEYAQREPSKVLGSIVMFFTRLLMFIRTFAGVIGHLWGGWRWLRYPVWGLFWLSIPTALGVYVYLLMTFKPVVDVSELILGCVIGGTVVVAACVGGVAFAERHPAVVDTGKTVAATPLHGVCGFFRLMWHGMLAFKGMTCPKVEVVED